MNQLSSLVAGLLLFTLVSLCQGDLAKSGVTKADIQVVQASWKEKAKDKVKMGEAIFTNLFADFPDLMKLFARFKDGKKDLLKSPAFIQHAAKIAGELDRMVSLLTDSAELDKEIKKIGQLHKAKGVSPDNFDKFRQSFKKTLVQTGAFKLGSPLEASWTKIGDYMLSELKKATA